MRTKILYIALLYLSSLSCSFLEVETVGRTTIPNFFSDVNGLKAGLTGCYSEMFNYYSSEFYKYPEVAGNMVDLKMITAEPDMINQFNFTSDAEQETGAVGYIWRKILETLANVNNLLEYCPAVLEKYPAHKKEIDLIKAQALFMRAICHFDLCRVYAQPYNYTSDASHIGIPVLTVTPGPDDLPSRVSVNDVYTQIITDLKESEQLFGNTSMQNAYLISKDAVQALLSRVYLYMEDWDNSISYSSAVIANIELAQGQDYLGMYSNLTAGKEAVLRLNGGLKSKTLGTAFYSSTSPVAVPADTLMKLFDNPKDMRLRLFEAEAGVEGKFFTKKYFIAITYTPDEERYDPFILRVSEMYLNRAEAYLQKNLLFDAETDIKVIQARALGENVSEIHLDYAGRDELFSILKKERAKELCFEGHNFFDIIRQKDDLTRGETTTSNIRFLPYPNDLFVLPIPQTELDANTNMVGNPSVND